MTLQECQRYLKVKGLSSPDDLANALRELLGFDESLTVLGVAGDFFGWLRLEDPTPCVENKTAQRLYAPNPAPDIPGLS